ncbi:vascular endothelial growth factor A isoform X2 [Colossoma macropomum]|uniref:vascular endothelial growth factor A isoform X2 n=1 Tax=Colossoma macropomum TaxID=42526 RepID=UPI001864E386|nr:vascular endothelial growth factor A isoform X2 [Colossoma macropomum]
MVVTLSVLLWVFHVAASSPHEAYGVDSERCGGFCGDEATVCVPVKNDTVLVQVQRISDPIVMIELPFVQHSGCSCRSRESLSASFVHF